MRKKGYFYQGVFLFVLGENMFLFHWMLISSAQGSQCSTPFALVMLENRLNSANEALARGDLQSFHNQMDSINYNLPCIVQPLDSLAATKLHLLIGINFWMDLKTDMAENYFSSVKTLKQTTQIPSTWLPNDTQLRNFFDASQSSSEVQPIPMSLEGKYYFDGSATNQQPLYRPTVYQYVIDDRVVQTKILQPGEKIPSYPTQEQITGTAQKEFETENYVPTTTILPTYDKSQPWTPNWYFMSSGLTLGITYGTFVSSKRARKAWDDVEYVSDDAMLHTLNALWEVHTKSKRTSRIFGVSSLALLYMGYRQWNISVMDIQSLFDSKNKKNKTTDPIETNEPIETDESIETDEPIETDEEKPSLDTEEFNVPDNSEIPDSTPE